MPFASMFRSRLRIPPFSRWAPQFILGCLLSLSLLTWNSASACSASMCDADSMFLAADCLVYTDAARNAAECGAFCGAQGLEIYQFSRQPFGGHLCVCLSLLVCRSPTAEGEKKEAGPAETNATPPSTSPGHQPAAARPLPAAKGDWGTPSQTGAQTTATSNRMGPGVPADEDPSCTRIWAGVWNYSGAPGVYSASTVFHPVGHHKPNSTTAATLQEPVKDLSQGKPAEAGSVPEKGKPGQDKGQVPEKARPWQKKGVPKEDKGTAVLKPGVGPTESESKAGKVPQYGACSGHIVGNCRLVRCPPRATCVAHGESKIKCCCAVGLKLKTKGKNMAGCA